MRINRGGFKSWAEGVYLNRKADGTLVVGDLLIYERVMEVLENGGYVGLLVKGKPFSFMFATEDSFEERPISEATDKILKEIGR